MKHVTMIDLSVFERITPLASGYLQAYAQADPVVGSEYTFTLYSTSMKTSLPEIARTVLAQPSDVFAFSCYVWNMGLMRRLVQLVRDAYPEAHLMLGGPQVMHHAERYLTPADPRMAVCNGEGEQTFTAYLQELLEPVPDLSRVEGISFYTADRQLVTTPERARIADLSLIPSPYLTGVFEPIYSVGILETNRGCPFHCGFCFWGAATNDRVYRFEEERVREEISWIARNDVSFLYIADANWGMLSRDVEFSEHLAESARQHGSPAMVYFSAAKNKPHVVTKIVGALQSAGLIATQPVSLQTLEPASLKVIERSNIKIQAFEAVQEDLRERNISSFVELIWPLPAETLGSFQDGISTLCDKGAQTIIAYSHLLLHNTPIFRDRERLGLQTRPAGDGVAEAEIVVQTRDVSPDDFADGMRYFYAVHALHNTLSIRALGRLLTTRGECTYRELFSGFVDYWKSLPPGDPIVDFVESSIRNASYYDIGNYGLHIHNVLHEHRQLAARHLREFVQAQTWWADPAVRAAYELDVANRPYIYSTTPMDALDGPTEFFQVKERLPRGYRVAVDPSLADSLRDMVRVEGDSGPGALFTIDHKRLQYPFMTSQSLEHNANYCYGMIEKIENIAPIWRQV